MIPRWPHPRRLSYQGAVAIQNRLRMSVVVAAPRQRIRYVAGLDAAFADDGRRCLAVAVLWDMERQTACDQSHAARVVGMPYLPGLLTFREGPALLAALRGLRTMPDALLCDGQGIAHMRRFGVASHLGVLCDLPSVGCAKSRLIGTHAVPGHRRGDWVPLLDGEEIVGSVLRTRDEVRPVYVSVGHRFNLVRARELILRCTLRSRIPEPTRLADIAVAVLKRETPRRWH